MKSLAIRTRNLSKKYTIDTLRQKEYLSLREDVYKFFRRRNQVAQESFWALQDLNIEIHRGELIGVVGSNGSGKSTFLKILSRVVFPTEGEVELYGRVGALLEVVLHLIREHAVRKVWADLLESGELAINMQGNELVIAPEERSKIYTEANKLLQDQEQFTEDPQGTESSFGIIFQRTKEKLEKLTYSHAKTPLSKLIPDKKLTAELLKIDDDEWNSRVTG